MVKENKLKKSLEFNFQKYTPSLRSENLDDRLWACEVLGRQHFVDAETIPEILEGLEKIYHTEHHWFLKAYARLEFHIRYAFYNGMYDEDNLGSFCHNFYNEKIVMNAMNNREESETIFDGIWDLYVRVLTELNYIH